MGVVGIYIHGLKNSEGYIAAKGENPFDYITHGDTGKKLSSIVKCEGLPIFRTEKRAPKGGLLPLCLVSFFGSSSIVVKESPELG